MVPGALPRADLWLPFQGDRELRNIKKRKRGELRPSLTLRASVMGVTTPKSLTRALIC